MNTHLHLVGSYWALTMLPTWVTAGILFMLTIGAIFILRDRSEGLFYNTSYGAMIGDGALLVFVLMAAGILQRGVSIPNWLQSGWFHVWVGGAGVLLGVIWWAVDAFDVARQEKDSSDLQWGDVYHHLVIAPLLCYLVMSLFPVVYLTGTQLEKAATVVLILIWASPVGYDAKTKRLDQRRYHGLGAHLDAIKMEIELDKIGVIG